MPGRKSKRGKWKKFLIPLLKWISALVPVCAFIYLLYYYKQFDFLKEKPVVVSKTEVLSGTDSLDTISSRSKEELLGKIKIQDNEWRSVGGIAIHNMTIVNGTNKALTNVEVEFKYLSETQAVVTSKIITIKASVPANKSSKVSGVSVGYVSQSVVGCDTRVVNAKF
ncbi:hypothetical protein DYBT9623_04076 [Dyadobacter sp. CECT 9623]|uniref:Uncharacterized protein n=1 Tax=Dyadobacter linearis TaxID=2823330 RepID=A0ABM8UUS2_9BACT|nr:MULTISPECIES: hypothetical protein [unclassified Dyadobacter]MCE7059580.1 hypothetical protein [Dyadobacter sp. CY343]CAG5072206.1 hypothetical protein DYBT9623_04076 [Dyadobacter sp. CECT 9623]